MSHVRPFVEADIPQVTHLHEKVIVPDARSPRPGRDPYRAYFSRVFLDNPYRRGPWVLVDAKKPEVLRAFRVATHSSHASTGSGALGSSLGEWCLGS